MYTYIYIYIYKYMYTYIYIYVCVCVCICVCIDNNAWETSHYYLLRVFNSDNRNPTRYSTDGA